jgi:hypothetical protein
VKRRRAAKNLSLVFSPFLNSRFDQSSGQKAFFRQGYQIFRIFYLLKKNVSPTMIKRRASLSNFFWAS